MSIKTGKIQLTKSSQLTFSIEDYKGTHYGSIRVWLDSPTYKGPTPNGLTLNKEILEDILATISKITKRDIEVVRSEKIIGRIRLNSQKELRVSLHYYKSRPKLDIREYISSGRFQGFTKRGISISPEHYEDFLKELQKLKNDLPNSKQERLFEPNEPKPQKEKELFPLEKSGEGSNGMNILIDKWLLLVGVLTFLVIVAPIIYLVTQSINKPPRDLRIDISNKSNKTPRKFKAGECNDCKKLTIKDKNNKVIFEESLDNFKENKFREYLTSKAKEGDKENTTIKLFYNQFPDRLVDISLDISNSVIFRNNESRKKESEIKYSDFVFQRLRDYLEENQGILPRDTVNVRFYGPEIKDTPCNNKLVIKYSEPEWDANIIYSELNNQLLIEIGDKVTSKPETNGSEIIANNTGEIYKIIKNFYDSGISNTNAGCHFGTYLIPYLTQISDDIVNKNFTDYEFILVTDGEFYLRDDNTTGGKEVYSSPENYGVLKNYLQKKANKGFIMNGSSICKNSDDKFIIVGMEYSSNLSYRSTVQQFYNELLKPCRVIFENF